ncbi:HNH endonuclease signature motif containing protein [Actinomadura flavalba]|uniref:HNH endonuclease signature motif containing protein n=1 Tax=Actinomadura flavalba TaxID=1120938 RepID=UPI0003A403D2|nr:HNH endonuclease signature motif containing protein [Actinomadura flavalba]
MNLAPITRTHVLAALAEFDRLGRAAFLAAYGFAEARQYFVHHEGRYYDSKAVVGAAYGHATGRPLTADEFSGGRQTVARLLESLGFTVTDGTGPTRDLVQALTSLRVQPTDAGPARHQPIVVLWAMGRAVRGRARLVRWSEARVELRGLLREYGRDGARPSAEYPLLALARHDFWEMSGYAGERPAAHGEPRGWMDAQDPRGGLAAWAAEAVQVSPATRDGVTALLGARFFDGAVPEELLRDVGLGPVSTALGAQPPSPVEEYVRRCAAIRAAERAGHHERRRIDVREARVRSSASVQAVLLRSGGRCENPACAGQPDDVTRDGAPLLEVDHVDDHAAGGRDHPAAMVALCPNCHAVKTRGRGGERLREVLRAEARERHVAWYPGDEAVSG